MAYFRCRRSACPGQGGEQTCRRYRHRCGDVGKPRRRWAEDSIRRRISRRLRPCAGIWRKVLMVRCVAALLAVPI